MAKKKSVRVKHESDNYWPLVAPSFIGGAVAWFFSGNLMLGFVVAIAVAFGNYVGQCMKK